MTILHWVSRLLTHSVFRQQATARFIHVAIDLYKKTGFLYTSPVICIENHIFYTRHA